MTLRGYNGTTFEEKSRLAVHSSVLSMLYIDEFDELITAGQGYVFSWHLKMIEYGFLVDPKNPPFFTEINCKYCRVIKTAIMLLCQYFSCIGNSKRGCLI